MLTPDTNLNKKPEKNMAEKKLEDKRGDNGTAGYVDEQGNWVIEPKFDDAWSFEDGIAKIKLKGKYGFIKPDGTYLVEPKFDDAGYFSMDLLRLSLKANMAFSKQTVHIW